MLTPPACRTWVPSASTWAPASLPALSHPCRVCAEPTCSRRSPNAPPVPAAQALTPGRRRRSPSLPVLLPADYLLLCQRWLRGECGIDGLIGKERSCLTLRPLTLRRPRWPPALSRAACGSALVCCLFQTDSSVSCKRPTLGCFLLRGESQQCLRNSRIVVLSLEQPVGHQFGVTNEILHCYHTGIISSVVSSCSFTGFAIKVCMS